MPTLKTKKTVGIQQIGKVIQETFKTAQDKSNDAFESHPVHAIYLKGILQNVLQTNPQQWDYFFETHRAKAIFQELASQINNKNFFHEDYSIEIFLNFLKEYVKQKFKQEELLKMQDNSLKVKFDGVIRAIQKRFIQHHNGLNNSTHIQIVSQYLAVLEQLLKPDYRETFKQSEISLTSADLQAIGRMLSINSRSMTDNLIQEYVSLLKLSFDTPKLLVKYDVGLNIASLAKACFSNKKINVHVVATQFFDVLGYQGQLLDYYQSQTEFNISAPFLIFATQELKKQALTLQSHFFQHLYQRKEIKRELLQHYLLKYFFEIIFKKYPESIKALQKENSLHYYIKFDYVALPKQLFCKEYPSDSNVLIEYDHLPDGVPEMACEAIKCSQKSSKIWKAALNLKLPHFNSNYTYRVANSYDEYKATCFAYGHSTYATGFYIQGQLINNTALGVGYSYWGNDTHNFIEVSRHEARHHDHFVFSLEALSVNSEILPITVKTPNEGLAVRDPCAPGFIDQNFTNEAAPSWFNLYEEDFIGYSRAWLYTNYLTQRHPEFYQDHLTLNKTLFKKEWQLRLENNEQDFINWLPYLKQVCRSAPKKLSLLDCPSPFLNDYLPLAELKLPKITTTSLRTPRQITNKLKTRTITISKIKSDLTSIAPKPFFYDDYLSLMYAINDKNINETKKILKDTKNLLQILNYQDPARNSETPLHYALIISRGRNCSESIIETLCSFGAQTNLVNIHNQTAYHYAENCENKLKIKSILDKHIENLHIHKETNNNQSIKLTTLIPISALGNGVIAEIWNEVGQRNQHKYPYLPNIIHYGLKPLSLAIDTAVMNSLVVGAASSFALEDIGLSFAYYLGVNYLGLVFAQLGDQLTQKIQNKLINLLVMSVLYIFLLNPSLLIELLTNGLNLKTFSNQWFPLLGMLSNGLLFKAGEYGTGKMIEKFFPKNPAQNNQDRTYISYQLGEQNEDTNKSSIWRKELVDCKENSSAIEEAPPIIYANIFAKNKKISLESSAQEQSIPMTSFKENVYTSQPNRHSLFPPPPTAQELEAMGVSIDDVPKIAC